MTIDLVYPAAVLHPTVKDFATEKRLSTSSALAHCPLSAG